MQRKGQSNFQLRRGFSLLEVLVSAILMALVFLGLANIFVTGKRYIMHSRHRMTGAELGKVFLAPLQMQVRQDTWSNAANRLGTATNYTANHTMDSGMIYNATYNITNHTATLKKVKLTINWTEPAP